MKKEQDLEQQLELLSRIGKVDAPPFLYTRISAAIADPGMRKVSGKLVFASLALILLLNAAALFISQRSGTTVKDVAQSMQLMNDNTLYR